MQKILKLLCSFKAVPEPHSSTTQLTKTFSFTQYPPPPPKDIFDTHRTEYEEMLLKRRYVDLHTETDTSLKTLYRLYEYIVLDKNIEMRNEIEYFWNRDKWAICEIQDPEDNDPIRNVELGLPRNAPPIMTNDQIDEFRKREKKFETVPDWTKKVKPLGETLRIPHIKGGVGQGTELELLEDKDDKRASIPFKEKNILIWQPHILFI